jgi:hypothetical protein
MPRLDNSHPEVIEYFELDYDPEDPGKTPPVDICLSCYYFGMWEANTIDHPPYEDGDYKCASCGKKLERADDDENGEEREWHG